MSIRKRQKKTASIDEALRLYLGSPEAALEMALARLWRQWPQIVGPDLADIVRPLGRRKTTMLVGAENSFVMQEFLYFGEEILAKANGFLGHTYFQKVQIELMAGRPGLDQSLLPPAPPRPRPSCPEPLGNLLPCMDPASPIARCYRAYVRQFRPELLEAESPLDS